MGAKMKLFVATVRDFLRSQRGNVAMMFGVMLLPLMIGAAAGLDFTRAMLVRQQMSEALDAAALAVGSTPGLDQTKAQALAQKYFDANYTVDKTEFGAPTISIPASGYDANGSVQITATNTMPTVLMRIAGINSVPLSTSSNVVWGQTKVWVALVLDNSGSMNDSDAGGTKIAALKNGVTGTDQLLDILEKAATNPGDVQVGVVPFSNSLNMSAVGTADIDWGEWDAPPKAPGINATYAIPNPRFSTPATIPFEAWGPGDSCPFYNSANKTRSPFGFECRSSGANTGTSKINFIASSGATKGLICPGVDPGTYDSNHRFRYYNGCYTSTAGTGTVQVAKGSSATCKDSTTSFGFSSSNCSCSGSGSTKTCNTKKWVHTWVPNNHSTWSGCVMDRQRAGLQTMTTAGLRPAAAMSYDTSNVQPSSGTPDSQFPAENSTKSCPGSSITTLGDNWAALKTQVNAMVPAGFTNQAIGVAHGWQMLTPGAPYSTPAVPANTTRYLIIFSDGLNTKDRWWDDSTDSAAEANIDDYEKSTCDAAKADGVIIYSVFLEIAGGNSAPLKYCASDPSKYFELSSTTTVSATFKQIAQQITNVRVMK